MSVIKIITHLAILIVFNIFNFQFGSAAILDDKIQVMVSLIMTQSGNSISKSFQAYANRSCTQDYTLPSNLNKNPQINEICVGLAFDYSSSIKNFECSDWLCNKNGKCFYDYFSNYVTCFNCTINYAGDFCVYTQIDFKNFISDINSLYQILQQRLLNYNTNQNVYLISSSDDYQAYFNLLQVLIPFYSTSFKDNNNEFYRKYDFLNGILYNNIDPSVKMPTSTYSLLSYLVRNSVFSFQFDYLKFIYFFAPDETLDSHSNYFGRSSIWLDSKKDTILSVGIQNDLDLTSFAINYYYGTGGYPKIKNNQIQVKITKQVSQYIFGKYYTLDSNDNWSFKILFVLSYVFNPNLYYTHPGILMRTPIVSFRANKGSVQNEFTMPEDDYLSYDYFEFTLPWSSGSLSFLYGDIESNCRVMRWGEVAGSWFSVFDAYISQEKSTSNYVVFYTKQFGTLGVDCDNVQFRTFS